MTSSHETDALVRLERRVLRAMCQGERATALGLLHGYRWRDPLHGTMFESLASLPSGDPEVIREQLPTRLALRGFPDVAWEDFFQPYDLSSSELQDSIRQLRTAA